MRKRRKRVWTCFRGEICSFLVVSEAKKNSGGISLEQHVVLKSLHRPTSEERKLIEDRKKLYDFSRVYCRKAWRRDDEIRFRQLVESVRKHPANYLHPNITLSYEQRIA